MSSAVPNTLTIGLSLILVALLNEFSVLAINTIGFDWQAYSSRFEQALVARGQEPSFVSSFLYWCMALAPRLIVGVVLVGVPALAAARAIRSDRWPRVVLTAFAAFQLLTMFEAGVLGVVSALLALSGSCLLWFTTSRRFAQQESRRVRKSRTDKSERNIHHFAPSARRNSEAEPVRIRTFAGRPKSVLTAYLLLIVLGVVGGHEIYLRRAWIGALYGFVFVCGLVVWGSVLAYLSLGGLAISLAIDGCRMHRRVIEVNKTIVGGEAAD